MASRYPLSLPLCPGCGSARCRAVPPSWEGAFLTEEARLCSQAFPCEQAGVGGQPLLLGAQPGVRSQVGVSDLGQGPLCCVSFRAGSLEEELCFGVSEPFWEQVLSP